MYFRGRSFSPTEHGTTFVATLEAAGVRILPDLFTHFLVTQIGPPELMQLLEPELAGPSAKFMEADLGILSLDAGRYQPTCSGEAPRRILEEIEKQKGVDGTTLLSHFGGPPYGYTGGVIKACVAGLLRAGKVKLLPEGGAEITAIRDVGAREVFDAERTFRRASILPGGDDEVGPKARAEICRFLESQLSLTLNREENVIADVVGPHIAVWR